MTHASLPFRTARAPVQPDTMAPDGSEIRLLVQTGRASMVHCTLPAGAPSVAVAHRTVEEVWYCLQGQGRVWHSQGEREETVDVEPGRSLTIPLGTRFQFRNTGCEPLAFVIVSMPPWPGEDEAFAVPGACCPGIANSWASHQSTALSPSHRTRLVGGPFCRLSVVSRRSCCSR